MTRYFEHFAAAMAALLITASTLVPVVTVPPADVSVAAPVLA